jgi:glucose 1-dehydrogenase
MDILKGKVAVITGGSRGLGYSIAQAYAQDGAQVVIGSRSATSVEKALSGIRTAGGEASGIACDTGDRKQVEALAEHAIEKYGHLDIWMNNAGLSCPIGPTVHIPPQTIDALTQTNVVGVYNGSLVAMHHFLKQGKGKLINLLGRGYKSATPMFNPYGASKAWVHFFTISLAKEYRDSGVSVFLFHPGLVKSDMMGHLTFVEGYVDQNMKVFKVIARMFALEPEISANKAVWLASTATDGKTGLFVNLLNMGVMLKGAGREGMRALLRRPAPPLNVQITTVPAAFEETAVKDIANHEASQFKPGSLHAEDDPTSG